MSTDIQQFEDTTTSLTTFSGERVDGLAQLREWAARAHDAADFIRPLVDTAFLPDSYRPKIDPRATAEERAAAREIAVATGTAAVLQGAGLGLDPLTSLSQIDIIRGRPAMRARIKVALLMSRGHEVWTEDHSDTRAVVCGRRRGSQNIERVTITMDMARKAGWDKNPSGAYQKTPADMLWARAAGRVCDRVAPDVLLGIPAIEELEDEAAVEVKPVRTRTVQRQQPVITTSGTPALPAASRETTSTPEPADNSPILVSTWNTINARLKDIGVNGEGKVANRLAVVTGIIGRSVDRGSSLTATEGQLVMDNLAGDAGERLVAEILGWDDGQDNIGPVEDAPAQPAAEVAVTVPPQDAVQAADPTIGGDPWSMPDGEDQ